MVKMNKNLAIAKQKAQQHALSVALIQSRNQPSNNRRSSKSKQARASSSKSKSAVTVKALDVDNSVALSLRKNEQQVSGRGGGRLQSAISKSRRNEKGTNRKNSPTVIQDIVQFVDETRSQVGKFGARGLDKRKAKEYEIEESVKLGCKRPKKPKMPMWLLERARKNQKIREEKQKEHDRQNGKWIKSKRTRSK